MTDDGPVSQAFADNQALWNRWVRVHLQSSFYDVEGFVAGRNSLTAIERALLGDVAGQEVLHLQCHFGQDTLSIARLGARVTGLDFAEVGLRAAADLADRCGLVAHWVHANVLDSQPALDGRFDVVFTSFGAIGWLPDLKPWGRNIARYLKPGGRFVLVEFHPFVWMYDDAFLRLAYPYFCGEPIVLKTQGSYAAPDAPVEGVEHGWNHAVSEILQALLDAGLTLERVVEEEASPFPNFAGSVRGSDGRYRIPHLPALPMVLGVVARR
jgi:SAM-dependent methyltransferase